MKLINRRNGSIGFCINDENSRTIGKITLKPGINELSDKQVGQLKNSEYFQCFVESNQITVDSGEALKAQTKKSKTPKKVTAESIKELIEDSEDEGLNKKQK